MNELLMVLECADEHADNDHTLNTVTAIATCENCGAETRLTPAELMDVIA